ncbi:MAG: hypothetical protein AMXMBFR7_03670 [Planctomycetota bacterium]
MSSTSQQPNAKRSFVEVGIEMGWLTQAQVDEALAAQKKLAELGVPDELSAVLVKKGVLSDDQLKTCQDLAERGARKIVAGYEIISRLGHGAMGAVYKARQISMDRIVALKILPPKLGRDPAFKERFVREARASGRLDHLHIVHGIDVGDYKGVTYFAMEYIDGPTVKSEIKRLGKLEWREAVRIARQIANALAYAWKSQHVVHRDIKPDNIMLTADGTAKLCDLGLAKEVHEAGAAGLTESGQAVGTPHYISPEQAKGKTDIDTRSDVYGLGASLYHMATGNVPFDSPNPTSVMVMHVTEVAPAPRDLADDLPAALEWVIAKAMAKDPADRYQIPDELEADLQALLEGKAPVHALSFTAPSSIRFVPAAFDGAAGSRTGERVRKPTTGPQEAVHARTTKRLSPIGPGRKHGDDRIIGVRLTSGAAAKAPMPGTSAHDSQAAIETVKGVQPVLPGDRIERAKGEPLEVPPQTAPTPEPAAKARVAEPEPAVKPQEPRPEPVVRPEPVPAHVPSSPKEPAAPPKRSALPWVTVAILLLGAGLAVVLSQGGAGPDTPQPSTPPGPPEPAAKTLETPIQVTITPDTPPVVPDPRIPEPAPPKPVPQDPTDAPPVDPATALKWPAFPTPEPKPADPPNPAKENEALLAFDKISRDFKNEKLDAARKNLEPFGRYADTEWYRDHRSLVESAWRRVGREEKPWSAFFTAPFYALSEPPGDRWLWHYDQLTFEPNNLKEWLLLPGTNLNWKVGAWTLTAAGGTPPGLLLNLPLKQVEKLEAEINVHERAEYGWALFPDLRGAAPIASCWYLPNGSIHLWLNEVDRELKIKHAPEAGLARMAVQFAPERAWIHGAGGVQTVALPPSPTGRVYPALLVGGGAISVGPVRVFAQAEPGHFKKLLDEDHRVRRLRNQSRDLGMHKLTLTVACQHPAALFVNTTRARGDIPKNYKPQEFQFTMPAGAIVSVRQFPPAGQPGGPVLLDVALQDGSAHAGTALTPHIFTAHSEIGLWNSDPRPTGSWHPATAEALPKGLDAPVPPNTKAGYVSSFGYGLVLRYVFDPADLK